MLRQGDERCPASPKLACRSTGNFEVHTMKAMLSLRGAKFKGVWARARKREPTYARLPSWIIIPSGKTKVAVKDQSQSLRNMWSSPHAYSVHRILQILLLSSFIPYVPCFTSLLFVAPIVSFASITDSQPRRSSGNYWHEQACATFRSHIPRHLRLTVPPPHILTGRLTQNPTTNKLFCDNPKKPVSLGQQTSPRLPTYLGNFDSYEVGTSGLCGYRKYYNPGIFW